MLRRLTPFLATFVAMLLDTAVFPVIYHGTYTVPLTLCVVMCIGLLRGRLMGLFMGMIGGLLIDITTGILGVMTFYYMAVGLLIGLIVDEQHDTKVTGVRFHLRRAVVSFLLCFTGEVVFCVYRYFVTAAFEWSYLQPMLIRSAIMALLTVILCPFLSRLIYGKKRTSEYYSARNREVKHF